MTKNKIEISLRQDKESKVLYQWSSMVYELYSTLNIKSIRPNVRQMLSNNSLFHFNLDLLAPYGHFSFCTKEGKIFLDLEREILSVSGVCACHM